jgi:7-cyano-7-deazaguanine synthase
MKTALVLFSGGQDSTTCLAWALDRYECVESIGFDYGQRHRVELDQRSKILKSVVAINPLWSERLGDDRVIDLSVLGAVSETALTRDVAIGVDASGLPNTFVPGRNIMFLTLSAAVAYRRGIGRIVAGMCETDQPGYPDCRDDTIKALQVSLNLAMERSFVIETPLMWTDKAETWRLAYRIGGDALVRTIVDETHTCYLGERGERHEWGYGCGACPACDLRADGYRRFMENAADS